MKANDEYYQLIQKHLDYSDEEMTLFFENPRNQKVLEKTPELMSKTIVMKVVESHGCNSQHKVGDRIVFDGAGNLLTKLNPSKVCIFALHSMSGLIFGVHELIYAGVDPNQIYFNRTGCHDVGVRCGGWGNIVLEVQVEDRA